MATTYPQNHLPSSLTVTGLPVPLHQFDNATSVLGILCDPPPHVSPYSSYLPPSDMEALLDGRKPAGNGISSHFRGPEGTHPSSHSPRVTPPPGSAELPVVPRPWSNSAITQEKIHWVSTDQPWTLRRQTFRRSFHFPMARTPA